MTLILFWIFIFAQLLQTQNLYNKYSISFENDYAEKEFTENWELYGVARIHSYEESPHGRFLELTPPLKSQKGAAWTKNPVALEGWEVVIYPHLGAINGPEVPVAEGFAFWYTKDKGFLGDAFGSKERYKGISVSYDSFDNDNSGDNPALYISSNSGDFEYDPSADGTGLVMAHYPINLFKYPSAAIKINLDYNGKLEVFLDKDGIHSFISVMSVHVNVPSGYYFGLSASTGGVFDHHRIKKMTTYSYSSTWTPEKDVADRKHSNKKEEILKKDASLHQITQPKFLLDSNGDRTTQAMSTTLNHILLRQYVTSISMGDRFEDLHDIVTLVDSQNSLSFTEFRDQIDDILLIAANRTTILNEFTKKFDEIEHRTKELHRYAGEMHVWQGNLVDEQYLKLNEKIQRSDSLSSGSWTFYILSFVCFVQIILIGLWLTSERRKRLSSLFNAV